MNIADHCEEEPIRQALSESGLLEKIQEMKDGLDTQLTTEIMEKGRIAEQGTHEELLSRGGKYAQMWRVQAGAYIDV